MTNLYINITTTNSFNYYSTTTSGQTYKLDSNQIG